MNCKSYKLGEIVSWLKGFAFNSKKYGKGSKMVVRITDFTLDSISTENAVFIEEDISYEKYILNEGDILIQTVGSWANNPNSIVGKVVRVPKEVAGNYLNQNIVKIFPNSDEVDNDYLYYYLKANKFSEYCVTRGQGAANQASITLDTIFRFPVNLPTIDEQKRIKSILLKYDNLIRNNEIQIKLLEDMAQTLYKEWFVHFRFPGYEKVDFHEGVPTIWNYEKIGDIMTFDRGISYSSEEIDCDEGLNLINLKNIQSFGGFRRDGTKKYNGKYKKSQVVKENDLIMGVTDMTQERRTVGAVALIPDIEGTSVISADLVKINSDIDNVFLYTMFRFGNISKYLSQFGNGANVIHLKPDTIKNKKILMPDEETLKAFTDKIRPIITQLNNLNNQNDNLIEQRDLLLPRLMSGKLEIG